MAEIEAVCWGLDYIWRLGGGAGGRVGLEVMHGSTGIGCAVWLQLLGRTS